MKKINKKSFLLLLMAAVILTVSVGVSVAYLTAGTDPVKNTFTPAKVDTEIEESFDGTTKSSIVIKNDDAKGSNIPVYVRVSVSGYWCDAAGNIIAPWDSSEVNLNTTANTDTADKIADGAWFKCTSDGYYYYNAPVAPGEKTTNLLAKPITYEKGTDGSYLVVNVLHQSIQSEPTSTVADEWDVTVADDGTISK